MNIRFSPFRQTTAGHRHRPTDISGPVPSEYVSTTTPLPLARRSVMVVHPDPNTAYRLKARLLDSGHRRVVTFFSPDSVVDLISSGHRADVLFVADFKGQPLDGTDLAKLLRLDHGYRGLIYSLAPWHAEMPPEALGEYGFSGPAEAYFA